MKASLPKFRELRPPESRALLRRSRVGRLAFTFKDRVDVEPIGYVFSGDWLYARTSPGAKLLKLAHHPWVAFEIDEVVGPFDWKSVVVHGTAYGLDGRGTDSPEYAKALGLMKKMDPRVF